MEIKDQSATTNLDLWVPVSKACEIFGTTPQIINQLVRQGKIKVGAGEGPRTVSPADIAKYLSLKTNATGREITKSSKMTKLPKGEGVGSILTWCNEVVVQRQVSVLEKEYGQIMVKGSKLTAGKIEMRKGGILKYIREGLMDFTSRWDLLEQIAYSLELIEQIELADEIRHLVSVHKETSLELEKIFREQEEVRRQAMKGSIVDLAEVDEDEEEVADG